MRVALLLAVLAAAACDEDAPAPAPEGPAAGSGSAPAAAQKTPATPARDPDPLRGLDDPEAIGDETAPPRPAAPPSPATVAAAVPDGGCVRLTETASRVWNVPGPAAVVADGDRFVVAGYATGADGEEVFVVAVSPEHLPVPVRTLPVSPAADSRAAAPGLAQAGASAVVVAATDGDHRVRLADVAVCSTSDAAGLGACREPSAPGWIEVGGPADLRFSPAVQVRGRHRVVAWTEGSTPMRLRVARVAGGRVDDRRDITPEASGAAVPAVVDGAPGELLFLDPRAGVSPIYRVTLGAEGQLSTPSVARPVGSVHEPPGLAAARAGDRTLAGYTALGMAAASAVGLVDLAGSSPPSPLVPGTGYGSVHVAAAAAGPVAVFAMEAPAGTEPESPREVRIRVAGGTEPGPALVLSSPARRPAIARRADGTLAVVYTGSDGVYAQWLRCDETAR